MGLVWSVPVPSKPLRKMTGREGGKSYHRSYFYFTSISNSIQLLLMTRDQKQVWKRGLSTETKGRGAKSGGRGCGTPTSFQDHGNTTRQPHQYHDPSPPRSAGIPRPLPPHLKIFAHPEMGGGGSWYSCGPREHLPVRILRRWPAVFPAPSSLLSLFK